MKTLLQRAIKASVLASLLLVTSCSSTIEFPKSDTVPAAHIEVKVETDSYDNNVMTFKIEHLASPERLSPPKSVYVVWAETAGNGVVNLGKLKTEAGDKAELRTLTPFDVNEVFITAEDDSMIRYPAGIEIGRVVIE